MSKQLVRRSNRLAGTQPHSPYDIAAKTALWKPAPVSKVLTYTEYNKATGSLNKPPVPSSSSSSKPLTPTDVKRDIMQHFGLEAPPSQQVASSSSSSNVSQLRLLSETYRFSRLLKLTKGKTWQNYIKVLLKNWRNLTKDETIVNHI